jgi:hypothetical protein
MHMRASEPVFQLYRCAGGDRVWWRLLSPNGRALGRVGSPLVDLAGCLAAIALVRDHLAELAPCVRLSAGVRWHWTLSLHDVVVVVGLCDHDRRIRSVEAWRRFVDVAAAAPVDVRVHDFVAGARRDAGDPALGVVAHRSFDVHRMGVPSSS